jgi:disulfide bond formation protein DsbB|tara:strand:+ start:3365 stop:3889 length:525 start_codon:yes stop_codon:yes gene_type:complete
MEQLYKSPKRVYSIILAASLLMIGVALYMEYAMNLKPCILCYMQRGAVILLGLLAFGALVFDSKKLAVFKLNIYLLSLSVLAGAALAIRQLYLQSLPADLVPSCAPDMEYLFDTLPFLEIFMLALTGDGNCAEVLWSFLGISIPGWVLIGLISIGVYLMFVLKCANEIHSHKQD